jgi:hypothetical protein
MSVTASLVGSVQLTDNVSGDTSLSKAVNATYTGTYSGFTQSQLLTTSPTSITLPGSPVQFLYFKNLATASGNNITVTWTPNGGASNVVVDLSPGALIVFSETNVSNGITALSVTAAMAATPCEYILCA